MSDIERNDVIKYRLSLQSPKKEPDPASNELNSSPRLRVQTARSRQDYSYAENLVMRVRLNTMKNEAKLHQMREQQTKHIMLQTKQPG